MASSFLKKQLPFFVGIGSEAHLAESTQILQMHSLPEDEALPYSSKRSS